MSIENHIKSIIFLQAKYAGKKFFVECSGMDIVAKVFPNTNFAVKEIEIPNFEHHEDNTCPQCDISPVRCKSCGDVI